MKLLTHHLRHYLPLIGVLIVSVFGIFYFSYDKAFQFAIVVAASISYVSWGIVHHHIHKDLFLGVFIEYVAIAMVGVVILYSLLYF